LETASILIVIEENGNHDLIIYERSDRVSLAKTDSIGLTEESSDTSLTDWQVRHERSEA